MNQLCIEMRPIKAVTPYRRPLRKNAKAVGRMVASIREYGFKIPLLVSEQNVVIDGELRLKAAQKLKYTELPVIVCRGWSTEQVNAFRIMANRSATWAEWDLDAVAQEIAELSKTNFDLKLTGFDPREIEEFLSPVFNDETIESIPETPHAITSAPGDLWMCGKHRVLCGDSTIPTDIEGLCGSSVPVLMITDPPYGVEYDPRWREEAGLGEQRQTGIVQNDHRVDWREAYELFRGDVAYVWHAGLYAGAVAASLEQPALAFAPRSSGRNSILH